MTTCTIKGAWRRIVARNGALLLLALTGAAPLSESLPVRGSFSGTFRSESDPVRGPTLVHMRAEGVLSHLGRVTAVVSSPNVSVDLLRFAVVIGTPQSSGRIIAANGDELHGTFTYRQTRIPFSPLTGLYAYAADLKITGGTGRFAHATGSGVVRGIGNGFTNPWTFSVDVEGTISKVGSSR